jgi:hypothetical protein
VLLDLSTLPPGRLALLTTAASLLAAVTAGVFGLVTALVNGYSARKLARESAEREFRLATIRPFLDWMDARVRLFDEAMNLAQRTVTSLQTAHDLVAAGKGADGVARLTEARVYIDSYVERLTAYTDIFRPSWKAFVISDPFVNSRTMDFLTADHLFFEALIGTKLHLPTADQMQELKRLSTVATNKIVFLRLTLESFLFTPRPFPFRLRFFIWSKRKARQERLEAKKKRTAPASV